MIGLTSAVLFQKLNIHSLVEDKLRANLNPNTLKYKDQYITPFTREKQQVCIVMSAKISKRSIRIQLLKLDPSVQ